MPPSLHSHGSSGVRAVAEASEARHNSLSTPRSSADNNEDDDDDENDDDENDDDDDVRQQGRGAR